MRLYVKNSILALALSSVVIAPLQAKPSTSHLKEIRNEAGIMLNILKTSLKQNAQENIKFRADSVSYLATQGVVFEIDSGRRNRDFFGFDLQGLMKSLPVAPNAPASSSAGKTNFEININEPGIQRVIEGIFEHGDDFEDDARDKMRDLSEQQRELAWEKREHERSRRDLDFAKRNAEGDRRKEIEKRVQKLNLDIETLEAKRQSLDVYKDELKAEQDKKMAIRAAAKKQLYSQSLALFEETIGEMLCRYGAGIRSLPEDENITFVLSEFVEADSDDVMDSHDKVYVFKHKDVKACVTGKSNKDKLLIAATTYLF
jgi:hypothetical protein